MPPLIAVSDRDLLSRLPDPQDGSRESFRIQAAAGDSLDIEIYDVVWPWEPKRLMAQLRESSKAKTINVRINSPGGDFFGGVAIYNALVRHSARVLVDVDGLAASVASVIAMAGDEVRMGRGTFLMIHDPWVGMIGNSAELRETAALLDKIAEGIAEIYAERTGKTERELLDLMREETWFNAVEAVEAGFADQATEEEAEEDVKASFDLSIFAHAPQELLESMSGRKRSIQTKREFEAFLRDEGGFSHAAAKALAAAFKGTPEPREEDGSLLATIEAQIAQTRLAATLTY